MSRLAPVGLVALCAMGAGGCYLSHGRGGPGGRDAGSDAPARSPTECCLEVECASSPDAPCAEDEACGIGGCGSRCEGPTCGGSCCREDEVCAADGCARPGPSCTSDAACEPGWRCDPVGRVCVPEPPTTCYRARPFEPEIEWEQIGWGSISVPLVTQLTDDDGDGTIGPGDVPDLVLTEAPSNVSAFGRLAAFSGDDGRMLWSIDDRWTGFCSFATAAAGDLDGDGTVEIAVPARHGIPHVHVGDDPRSPCAEPFLEPDDPEECPPFPPDHGPYHDHGTLVDARLPSMHRHVGLACSDFDTPPAVVAIVSHEGEVERFVELPLTASPRATHTLVLTDLEGDGLGEVVLGGAVIGEGGVRWTDERLEGVGIAAADIDLDGRVEIVSAGLAFDHEGRVLWEATDGIVQGHPAVARVVDLEASGPPQVVVVDRGRMVARDGASGSPVWGPFRFAAGSGTGPPTIADFDGDGAPEVGVAADHAFVVLDPDLPEPHVRWELESRDTTPGTVGSSAFDFDGDGAADLAYSDECHVRILDGRDGTPLWVRSNPSRTVWEYPVVADLDADGEAELAVVSNLRSSAQLADFGCFERVDPWLSTAAGVRVYRDRLHHWEATRRTWNQHGYVLDTLGEDGSLPGEVPRPWDGHDTVRANPWLGEDARRLPDLRVAATRVRGASCGRDGIVIEARVENRGNLGSPAGTEVRFGTLGAVRTSRVLLPGGAEWVSSPPLRRDRLGAGPVTITVDPEDLQAECDEANTARLIRVACGE